MQRLFFLILFSCFGTSFAQLDTSRADSLIAVQLVQQNTNVTNADTAKTIHEMQLISFFAKKGIALDTTCSQVELYKEVYAWLGVRYKYAGLTKRGVDCAGFVKNICNVVYGTQLAGSARDHFKKCIPLERNELEEGDLVFFKIRQSQISHVGLYLGNGKFAHAAVHGGVMINDLSENYYNKYYFAGGRLLNAPKKLSW